MGKQDNRQRISNAYRLSIQKHNETVANKLYQRYQKKYFILFKKSTGNFGKFKVVILEKEGNICTRTSMNLKSLLDGKEQYKCLYVGFYDDCVFK